MPCSSCLPIYFQIKGEDTVNDKTELRTTRSERTSYGIYFVGQNLLYMFIYFFLKQFYVIDMAIPAATVATIFLVAQVWDAINDPLFGIVIDKVKLKKGKFLPWIRLATFLIPITTVAIFVLPNQLAMHIKVIYAFVSYLLWDFSYTICDAPIYALATAMTDNIRERTRLISLSRIFATIAMITLSVVVPQMYPKLRWPLTIAIIAALSFLCMLPISLVGKERYQAPKEKDLSFRDIWNYLRGNTYLKIFYLGLIVANTLNTAASVGNFFAIYNLGSESMITVVTLLTVIPMLIMAILIPVLNRKWDKFHIYIAAACVSSGLALVLFFVGYSNFTLFVILSILRGFGSGVMSVMSYMFVADCVEYGTFATGQRAEGITFSIQTFTTKLTGALSGAIGLYILAAFGFLEGSATQSVSAMNAIWGLITLLPAIGVVIQIVFMVFFYKLRDKDTQWMTKANMGEVSREEAESHITCRL